MESTSDGIDPLPSSAIPQADNPRILMHAWKLLAAGEPCDADALGVHPRQVSYYRSALRILGLDDGGGAPPPPTREDAIATLKTRFEKSSCGRAWLDWSGKGGLEDLDPATALPFLAERSDLTGTTLERRAMSLQRWHTWMTEDTPVSAATPAPDEVAHQPISFELPYGNYAPKERGSSLRWPRWSYSEWNDRLIDHYFLHEDPTTARGAVTRIPATPEELASIAGVTPQEAAQVADAFVGRILQQLPYGRQSFCRFCFNYQSWSPRSPEPPHFFAMLWFTCLVAYGYPTGEGGFSHRLWELLGKQEKFQLGGKACLPRLWEELSAWTRERGGAGDPIRQLELPPRSEHRPVIGYSHFLAFPNRIDRNALARILWESGLVGFEPPVRPVLEALTRGRKSFGQDFIEDMDAFEKRYAEGEDPRDSAFWRAVRQESIAPSADPSFGSYGERGPRTWLLFIEDEQGLRPIVGCRLEQALPTGFEAHVFEEPVTWPAYVTGTDGGLEAAWQEAFNEGKLVPIGARKLIAQGVLVLRESGSGEHEVVHGADVHGCSRALVRTSRLQPFLRAFRGKATQPRTQPSIVDGWTEIEGCEVCQLDELPPGLEGVTQLLRTMSPPSVAFVGGVRTLGGFLLVRRFFPIVRAPGVQSVHVVFRDGRPPLPCTASPERAGDWLLPAGLERAETVYVRASWSINANGATMARSSDTQLRLVGQVIEDRYRGKPSGHYYVESCPDPETDLEPMSEVPLGISTNSSEISTDLLEFDASSRYLGPGLGEMALEPRDGLDWLVVGKKKNPELLVFVGNTELPTMPARRRSSAKGDQRHWRRSFGAKRILVRWPDGRFTSLAEAPPAVDEAYAKYKHHNVDGGEEIPSTGLETQTDISIARANPDPATSQAVDVLAALGSRRAGLTYADVREVFQALLGNDDPIKLQQVLRGWTEAGLIDMLRSAVVTRFVVVPRSPRFVMVRRGPDVEATLVGLVTSVRRLHLAGALAGVDQACIHPLLPANRWQPDTFRIRGSLALVESVRRRAELGPSEWLEWPGSGTPPSLDISSARDRIQRAEPPSSYRLDASWDWTRASFYRGHRPDVPVRLERRIHADCSTIYVVTREDKVVLWTHSRAWALLEAYAAHGVPPFRADQCILTTTGRAPVHLPLPVGRLCVLIGEGLPGPSLESETIRYSYPFGPRLFELVERVLPREWLDTSSLPARSIHAGPHR